MEGAPGSSCAFPQDGITERGLCSPVEIPLKWVSVRPSLPPFFPLSPLIFLFLMSLCLPPLLQSAVMFRAFSPLLGFPLSFSCVSHPLTLSNPPLYHSPTCFPLSLHPFLRPLFIQRPSPLILFAFHRNINGPVQFDGFE